MVLKLLIVAVTAMVVTGIMDANGYSFTSQMVAAGVIGAFLGFIDSGASDDKKT